MTVPKEYSRFIAQVRINEPDLVIVMLGTNDCFRGLSAVQIAERMDRFLDSIGGLTKQILLISPPVLQCGDWVQDDDMLEESQELGEQYHELAERKGCLFADAEEWDIEMAYDGVHFSPEGHAVFAQKLEEKIKEVYEHKE
jgi:lysophospholipase L1-like esterase